MRPSKQRDLTITSSSRNGGTAAGAGLSALRREIRYTRAGAAMKRLLLLVALLPLTGCATVVNGRFQAVDVDSHPSGARVEVDCGASSAARATTPTKVTLERAAKNCSITLTRDGYLPATIVLERQRSRVVQANKIIAIPLALFTGAIAGIIGQEIDDEAAAAEAGFLAGLEAGSAPGRQIDKQTGAAYKWVPGRVYAVLVRPDRE